jgi:hypothetical protein
MAFRGGVDHPWIASASATAAPLIDHFRPDVVWGNFGSTSNLVVSKDLARRTAVPWVIDFKDNWDLYVHPRLRRILAWRFRNVSAFTSNARLHAGIAARWFRGPAKVIYSSVAPEMAAGVASESRRDVFQLTLIGSVYDAGCLSQFLRGVEAWLEGLTLAERAQVLIHYAGAALDDVRDALRLEPLSCAVRIDPNLDHANLAEICQKAAVNCYVWTPFGFHHKLLELMACRRPVISFPGEHPESVDLARQVGGRLWICHDGVELGLRLSEAHAQWKARERAPGPLDLSEFTWEAAAERLEGFLTEVVRNRGPAKIADLDPYQFKAEVGS